MRRSTSAIAAMCGAIRRPTGAISSDLNYEPAFFGLRDCGMAEQIGLELTVEEYVATLVEVFRLVRDVLANDGTVWLNLGDSYAGSGRGGNPALVSSTLQGSRRYSCVAHA